MEFTSPFTRDIGARSWYFPRKKRPKIGQQFRIESKSRIASIWKGLVGIWEKIMDMLEF